MASEGKRPWEDRKSFGITSRYDRNEDEEGGIVREYAPGDIDLSGHDEATSRAIWAALEARHRDPEGRYRKSRFMDAAEQDPATLTDEQKEQNRLVEESFRQARKLHEPWRNRKKDDQA